MLRSVVVAALLSAATAAWADAIEDKAELCAACHGDKGLPSEPAIPIIWGQNEGYLYLELRDFQKGARKDDRMTPIAQSLSKEDALALAAIFLPPSRGRRPARRRLQGGRGDCDDGDQLGGVHQLPSGAVSGRFVHSAPRGPGTRLSRQDDDGFPQSHPRQQSRHVRSHEHGHARPDHRDGRLSGGACDEESSSRPPGFGTRGKRSGDRRRPSTSGLLRRYALAMQWTGVGR